MQTIVFNIDTIVKDNLERLSLEVESHQSLIAFMLNHDMINNENFAQYQSEYFNFYKSYTEAKNIFQKTYVEPKLLEKNIDLNKASWRVDFADCNCVITIMD